jgi:acetylornithine deacetylase
VALGESVQQTRERFHEMMKEVETEDMWLAEHPVKIEYKKGPFYASSSISSDHPLVKVLQESAFKIRWVETRILLDLCLLLSNLVPVPLIRGKRPKLVAVPYGSEMALWNHLTRTPTLLYGPGDYRLAHTPNECVTFLSFALCPHSCFLFWAFSLPLLLFFHSYPSIFSSSLEGL